MRKYLKALLGSLYLGSLVAILTLAFAFAVSLTGVGVWLSILAGHFTALGVVMYYETPWLTKWFTSGNMKTD